MTNASLDEHARIGRGLICLAVIVGVGVASRALVDQIAVWTESEEGAALIGVVIGLCLALLALAVFSIMRSGANADTRMENYFDSRGKNLPRFKSRVDAQRPDFGGHIPPR